MTREEIMAPLPDDWQGWFVGRNEGGAIARMSRQPQPGDCEEALVEDHPDIVAFHAGVNAANAAIIPYGMFRARWEPSELEALSVAKLTIWQVDDFVGLAQAQGHVNLSGDTAAAAKALFVQIGVLTAERADVIFATA